MTRGVLLDTHVLIAHVNSRDIFGKATRRLLQTPHPFFSPLSIAEMRLKESVKKQRYLAEDITQALGQLGYKELPLVSTAAEGITGFPPAPPTRPLRHTASGSSQTPQLVVPYRRPDTAEAWPGLCPGLICLTPTTVPPHDPTTLHWA